MQTSPEFVNIHGRRWGRGWRPYLLLPKVVCVAVALGGTVMLLTLVFLRPVPAAGAEWLEQARLIRLGYTRVIVPALFGAMLLGAGLLLHHGRVLLRLRWLQVKLAVVLACVPALHLYMRSRSLALQAALREPADLALVQSLRQQLFGGTLAVLAFLLIVLLLGRIKPRLGQDYTRPTEK